LRHIFSGSETMTMPRPASAPTKSFLHLSLIKTAMLLVCSFLLGCLLTVQFVLIAKSSSETSHVALPMLMTKSGQISQGQQPSGVSVTKSPLSGLKVLVAIASFDFSQFPHLDEVLDAYHDLAVAGCWVDVVIHTTVAYPVALIDMWNTRLVHEQFALSVVVKPPSLRLHLVDCHRTIFYERLEQYDLFVYTEDDIRVTPSTVSAYLSETARVAQLIEGTEYKPSDFNVGIVRYEYSYPPNVIIDDKTRHVTMNVSRVYWEHSAFDRPAVPNAVLQVEQSPLASEFVTMRNHHQGMFLATRQQLVDWKDRPKCHFDRIRDRPGRGNQPSEGTQRVWMSSQMLYGGRHCKVQQVLPKARFPSLTVLHLPNKNYRRVGKYRNRTFSDGTEVFQAPHESLLSAMEVHVGLRRSFPAQPQRPYRGIRMVDEVNKARDRTPLLERRLREYEDYVKRGGVMNEYDMTRTALVEDE
jgi:hypothetical protein